MTTRGMQPQTVLTGEQMGEVDRATIAAGIPGLILMENAAARVVEYLAEKFSPVSQQRIVVVCGKGNNGGDGLAIARQLAVRFQPERLNVVLVGDPAELRGDAALNLAMLHAVGLRETRGFGPEMELSTLIVDALLGTGLRGPAGGEALEAIRKINACSRAKVVSVDIPSGLAGDSGTPPGEFVRADATITFTAPKICHVLQPACRHMGELRVAQIGTPAGLLIDGQLALLTRASIAQCFAKRSADSNKGSYGHVLVVAGARGKAGAAAMAGVSALRAGAGLATVACPGSVLSAVAAYSPEVMTEPLAETPSGSVAGEAFDQILELAGARKLLAIGPGLGTEPETAEVVVRLFQEYGAPLVIDADALNCLSFNPWTAPLARRILTPHPGEMARLTGHSIAAVQADRVTAARSFATSRKVTVVLKGERTLIAFPDGRVWINPTGSPAMATGGTGDILTGLIAGLLAQFPGDPDRALAAAVFLHGLAGEIAACHLTEQAVIATDLLRFLPEAMHEITKLPDDLV